MRTPLTGILLLALAAFALPVGAATITWSGAGANTNWSNAANWQGGVVPGAADRAAFTGIAPTASVTVDAPVTVIGIDFAGDANYNLTGSLVTVTGTTPFTVTSSTVGIFTLQTGVTFTAASPTLSVVTTASPGAQLNLLKGLTTFAGGTVQLQAGTAPFGQILLQNVRETAATAYVVSGNAAYFQGTNVVTGPITCNGRSLGGNGPKPFGTASIVMNQGVLSIISASSGTTTGPVTLQAPPNSTNVTQASLLNSTGPLKIQGTLNASNTQIINALANITVTGKLGGGAVLEIEGPGTVEFDGANGTFSGVLNVDSPTTFVFGANSVLDSSARLGVTGGSLIVGPTTQTVSAFSCSGSVAISVGQGFLNVNGPVTAGVCSMTLNVPATLSPPPGVIYSVMANGGQNVLPIFAGLPDGTVLNVNGTAMTVSYHGGRSGRDLVLSASGSTAPPPLVGQLTDMWWAGSAENGWGMSIVQHVDTLFIALYIYDSNGNPTWLVMPGGQWDASHTTYTGSLYGPVSSPYFAYDVSRFVVGASQGSIAITFQDNNNASVDYSIGGNPGHKVIQRQIYGNGLASSVDYSDLWWGGSAQNGWGITIMQQGTTLFPVWYTYDANGKPFWYVMPGGTWNAAGDTYSGAIYRTTSSPWVGVTYDPTKLTVTAAGTYSIKFAGTGATFSYTADGHSGSMALSRQPF